MTVKVSYRSQAVELGRSGVEPERMFPGGGSRRLSWGGVHAVKLCVWQRGSGARWLDFLDEQL